MAANNHADMTSQQDNLDSDGIQGKRKRHNRCLFIDDECSASDMDTSGTDTCDEHSSFIDDNTDDVSLSDTYRRPISPIVTVTVVDKYDVEFKRIATMFDSLDELALLYVVFNVSDDIAHLVTLSSPQADPVLANLPNDPMQTLSEFCTDYIGTFTMPNATALQKLIHARSFVPSMKKLATESIGLLQEYYSDDIHGATAPECRQLLHLIASLFKRIKQPTIDALLADAATTTTSALPVVERRRVTISDEVPACHSTPKRKRTFAEFSEEMSPPSSGTCTTTNQPKPTKRVMRTGKLNIAAYLDGTTAKEFELWLQNAKFKSLVCEEKRQMVALDTTIPAIFHRLVTVFNTLMNHTMASELACTHAAVHIAESDLAATQHTRSLNSTLGPIATQQESVLISDDATLPPYPSDCWKDVVVDARDDPRFQLLLGSWRVRESCPFGVFEHVPQPSMNKKHVLVAIFGYRNTLTMLDHITGMLRFNGEHRLIAVSGICGLETKPGVSLYEEPLQQILYLVLAVNRATVSEKICQHIIWYTDCLQIDRRYIFMGFFNNDQHYSECYADVFQLMKTSPECTFIGPRDDKLLKKLNLLGDDGAQTQLFKLCYEALRRQKITKASDAIAYIQQVVGDVTDTSDTKAAFVSLMGGATTASQTIKISLWWNNEMEKRKPKFMTTEIGRITAKLAMMLFTDIKKLCGGHLLNPCVDIDGWHEPTMGPMKFKGTLLQPAILNIIHSYRSDPTQLLLLLKLNKITPTSFFNDYFVHIVEQKRRNKTLIFSGGVMCGKSITANAILQLHHGKRITLEGAGSEHYLIDSVSDTTAGVGVIVLEDVQHRTFKSIDTKLRPHLDGDKYVSNPKFKDVSEGQWPATIITTNVPEDSDSDEEECVQSIRKDKILVNRHKTIKFRTKLETVLSSREFIQSIDESDILRMYWRYALWPVCGTLFPGAPRCVILPCDSIGYEHHHPMCPLIREIHANLSTQAAPTYTYDTRDGIAMGLEAYERILPHIVGRTFNWHDATDVEQCLRHLMGATSEDVQFAEDNHESIYTLQHEINHFIERVWKPLCYSASFMRGDYSLRGCDEWSHTNLLKHDLFRDISNDNAQCWTMHDLTTHFTERTMLEDSILSQNRKLERCALWIQPEDSHDNPCNWYQKRIDADKRKLRRAFQCYVLATQNKRRWKRVKRHWASIVSPYTEFDTLWMSLIGVGMGQNIHIHTPNKSVCNSKPQDFYD